MNEKHGIVVVGDALFDRQYYIQNLPKAGGDEKVLDAKLTMGGSAANTAYRLGRLGAEVAFFGRMGSDDEAKIITEELTRADVYVALCQYGGKTGYTVVLVDSTGERTMLSYRGASAKPLELTTMAKNYLQDTAVCLFSGYLLTDERQADFVLQAAKWVKQCGGLVALDPCPTIDNVPKQTVKAILALIDILLPNQRELDWLNANTQTDQDSDMLDLPCVAVKLGSKGAVLSIKQGFTLPNGKTFESGVIAPVAAKPITAVDTTGAGDAFNAGFLAAMMRGDTPRAWIAAGNQLAAECITHAGAIKL